MGRRGLIETTRWALLRYAPRVFLNLCRPDDAELGAAGEELAARHLAARGWRILGRRVATAEAELDLVCAVAGQVVCVEVKTARIPIRGGPEARRWRPGERLDARRLARQRRSARRLAGTSGRAHGEGLPAGRVDLFEVWIPARGPVQFHHHADLRRPLEHGTPRRDRG